MQNNKWLQLQNESDIRGISLKGVKGKPNFTDDVASSIAAAFAVFLAERKGKPSSDLNISIGIDSRLSGPSLSKAAIQKLLTMGCHVIDCGMASTPAMFMSTVIKGCEYDGAIMFTASHLPYYYNGMKFFTRDGGLEKKDILYLLSTAEKYSAIKDTAMGRITKIDLISIYADTLVKEVRTSVNHPIHWNEPLKGLRIIVDAGNGVGGFFVDKVLMPLGADTKGSQFLEPDGTFPNHIPNPENKEAVESIKRAVLDNKADFGIIFDADVDRGGAVEPNGKEINRNRLVALLSAIVLEEHPKTTIVTDSVTSKGLSDFIEEYLGGIHRRFKRGYRNVINEAIRLNNEGKECYLAIETSGHGAFKNNYFLDDGAYLITKILIKIARLRLKDKKSVGSLIACLIEPVEDREFRMNIAVENFKKYGNEIIEDLKNYAIEQEDWVIEASNYEGIRISFQKAHGDGWFLLRMSLHEALMPLNIESDSDGGVKKIALKLISFLKKYKGLDISTLLDYITTSV